MNPLTTLERFTDAVTKTHQQWEAQRKAARPANDSSVPPQPSFTIALSREAGTHGQKVAEAIGERLGWPVYDRELLHQLADELGVKPKLLEGLDERRINWLEELLSGLSSKATVTQNTYVRRLVRALVTLAAGGHCVIMGRGAAQILPPATTLRVRLIAPRAWRVKSLQESMKLSVAEATRQVEDLDKDRTAFVEQHFHKDPRDPSGYDLILNCERFSVRECADLVAESLQKLLAHTPAHAGR